MSERKTTQHHQTKEIPGLASQNFGLISVWHGRRIAASEDWKAAIDENLERADLVLLLVSADFLASDYAMTLR